MAAVQSRHWGTARRGVGMGLWTKVGARGLAAIPLVAVGLLAGCGGAGSSPTAGSAGATQAVDTVWLCRPGLADNPCAIDLAATVVEPGGSTHREPGQAATTEPPIDCFYIYPTVSNQSTYNSDLTIEPEQRRAAMAQASRF